MTGLLGLRRKTSRLEASRKVPALIPNFTEQNVGDPYSKDITEPVGNNFPTDTPVIGVAFSVPLMRWPTLESASAR